MKAVNSRKSAHSMQKFSLVKQQVVVVGSGGHAKVVIDTLESTEAFEIVGVTSKDMARGEQLLSYPVLGDDDVLPDLYSKGIHHAAVGVGGFRDNQLRTEVFNRLKALGFQVVTAVHPSVYFGRDACVGEGSILFPGVMLNTEVKIGRNVIVATGSSIDHETHIADHALISAGVTIGAYVNILEGALIALGAKVVSGVTIGRHALVAAGAVVVKDVPDYTTVMGIPAQPVERD